MPVSFSKSALCASSACETGLLLARNVTVLPWNFVQSNPAAPAAETATLAAIIDNATRATGGTTWVFNLIAVLPDRSADALSGFVGLCPADFVVLLVVLLLFIF